MKSMSCAYKNGNLISVSQSPPCNKFFAPPYLPPLSAPPLLCPPAMKMQYLGNPAKGKTEKQILNISLNLRFGKCNMSQILFRYYSQANLIYKFNETTILKKFVQPHYISKQIESSLLLTLLSVYKFIFASALICLPLSFLIQYVEKI